jgi:amino acid adenylation domain-containing protein
LKSKAFRSAETQQATAFENDASESIPVSFERVVAAHGSRLAVCSSTWQASYDQLNATANRVAHALIRQGGSTGDRIAVLMQHDAPQVAAVLGILKAGRIAVTLAHSEAASRLEQLIDDAAPALILTDKTPEAASAIASTKSRLVSYEEVISNGPTHNPELFIAPNATAHLVFTSGSTGRPKGVQQTHGQILRQTLGYTRATELTCEDRLTLLGSLSGGHGVGTMWTALLNGAALFPFSVIANSAGAFAEWIDSREITAYFSSASLFRHLMQSLGDAARFPRVRVVRLSSEPATFEDFKSFQRHFSEHCIFVHTLASSEIGLIAYLRLSWHDIVSEGRIPVGRPVEGVDIRLLDDRGRPVTQGRIGEIVARSRHMSSGYWQNEALTSERYSHESEGAGFTVVHTGDLARLDANGMLEFIGRKGSRVKIRGYTVEPAEVERAICKIPGIAQVVVSASERRAGQPQLAAQVIVRKGYVHNPQSLRQLLRGKLPSYMIPAAFVFRDEFPLTAHGKIDHARLSDAHTPVRIGDVTDYPRTETERQLVDIWERALDVTGVGRNDDFFDLGGDSLMAAVASAHIHAVLRIEISISAFSDNPVLADLARVIDDLGPSTPPSPARERRVPNQLPLSFNQEAYWLTSQIAELAPKHTMSRCSRIVGALDRNVLADCIAEICRRHEMLRTNFSIVNGQPVQIVHAPSERPMTFHDFAGDAQAEQKALRLWKEEATWVFDLANQPLASFTLIRLSEREHWLLYTHHHIVSDGWSWSIFFRELAQLYEARANGLMKPKQNLSQQYSDYTVWQHTAMDPDGASYRDALAWWANYILTASYPSKTGYREALLRCIGRFHPRRRLIKPILGLLLRWFYRVPLLPRITLPFQRPAPLPHLDASEGVLEWGIPGEVSTRLDDLARQTGATSYMVRLAAYMALLAVETNDPNVVLYTALTNRSRAATRDVFGFCASPTIIMVRCEGEQSFRQLLLRVRDRMRSLQAYADLPYDRVYRELREWKIKMPQGRSMLSAAWSHPDIHCGGIKITCLPSRAVNAMPAGFDVKVDFANEQRNCQVLFDASLYDPQGVHNFIRRFERLLDLVSQHPDRALSEAWH